MRFPKSCILHSPALRPAAGLLLGSVLRLAAAPLDLDPAWSGDGMVQFGFGGGTDAMNTLVIRPDGRMLTSGYGGSRGAMLQLLPTGGRDPSFGTNGVVITTFGVNQSWHKDLHLYPDGRVLAFSDARFSPVSQVTLSQYLPSGELDAAFGNGGIIATALPQACDASAGAVQPDGKLLTTGRTGNGLLLLRWLADGTPDPAFGTGGVVTTTLAGGNGLGEDLAVQPDGRIVVAATIGASTDRIAVLRYLADGTLDSTFGTAGVVVTSVGDVIARSLALQPDGKVLVGGSRYVGARYDSIVLRFTTGGAPDLTFGGGDGHVITPLGTGDDFIEDLTLLPDGRFMTVGRAVESGTFGFATCRFLSDGTLDSSYSGDGKQINRITGANALGYAIVVQEDGRIVLGGDVGGDFLVLRLLEGGALDTTLAGLGGVAADVGNNQSEATAAASLPDGGTLLAGTRMDGNGSLHTVVARLRADGSPHPDFNGGTPAIFPLTQGPASATAAAVLGDGNYLVAGTVNYADFFLLRLRPDGTLDPGFGTGGQVIIAVTPGEDILKALLVQPDGKILLGGPVQGTRNEDFGLVRLLADGTLDSGFGTGGKVITPVGASTDVLLALALEPGGKILAAGSLEVGTQTRAAICRFTAAGVLDPAFSGDGVDHINFGSGAAVARSVLALPDGKVLIGGDGYTGTATGIDFALARYLANGTLDTTFDGDGKATRDVAGGTETGLHLHLHSGGSYTLLGRASNQSLLAAVRFLPGGAPDPAFDGDGLATRPTPGAAPSLPGALRTPAGHYLYFGRTDNILTAVRVSGDYVPVPLPSLTLTRPPGGPATLTFPAAPGATYLIQRSTTLAPSSWTSLGPPAVAGGTATFTDHTTPPAFFRVQVTIP